VACFTFQTASKFSSLKPNKMKEDFKSTQILHLALALGSLLFFIIVNILNDFKYKEEFDSSDSFLI